MGFPTLRLRNHNVFNHWITLKKRRHWNLKEEALDRTLENSLWKRLWTCRKTDYEMNEFKKYTGRVILSGCVVCACFCVARKDLCTPLPPKNPDSKNSCLCLIFNESEKLRSSNWDSRRERTLDLRKKGQSRKASSHLCPSFRIEGWSNRPSNIILHRDCKYSLRSMGQMQF